LERLAFIDRSAKEGIPVIPVLLPGCPDSPKVTELLEAFTWIDLRKGVTEKGLALLVWGITGNKPAELSSGFRKPGRLPAKDQAQESARKPNPRRKDSKTWPRWEVWALGVGIVGLLVAIGAWLLPSPWGTKRPELYQVRVQVLDPENHPVSDAAVRTSTGNEPHLLPDKWWEVQIPRVKVPQDGKVTIWAEHEDWESSQADLVLQNDPNVQARIQLKPPHSWIRGRVVDDENRALAGVRITPQDGIPGTAVSDADGSFGLELPVPPERRVGLRAELAGWAPDTTFCYAGRDSCPIVLAKR
jgi:hypothetical protein